MRYLQALALGTIALAIIACSGCVGGGSNAQTFDTNHGKIQINTPETMEPTVLGSASFAGMLSLGKKDKGSPLIIITLTDNSAFSNFEYAVQTAKMMPLLNERELTTNDNHKMHWSVVNVAGFKQYEGIIDYGDDKGLVVSIKGLSETADMMTGEKVPGFSENEYLDIFESFKFVDSDGQSIQPTETDQDQSIQPTETDQDPTFHMVVIGDSIAWGNGLKDENKYSYIIADWLKEKLDKPVDIKVYAHSGATISGESDESGESIDQNLNSESPTLIDQVKNIENKDDVDLILVSGGINDVGVMNILNAYISSDEIDQRAQSIREPMKNLLLSLLKECKNAKIIVTNYYPIVSENSDITTIAAAYGLGVFVINDVTGGNVLDALTVKEKLIENSYMFNGGSLSALTDAVRDANSGTQRIAFAMVNFQPENSYAASQTWLWKLEGLGTNDDQFDYRSSLTSDPINKINAIGHPNRDGAIEYARAIKSAIESKGLDWLQRDATTGSEVDTIQEVEDDTASINASDISTSSRSDAAFAIEPSSGTPTSSVNSDNASVSKLSSDTSASHENSSVDTKTAYTKDGKIFISEERLEQNIRNGLANLVEYEKTQVPLDTIVAGASPE